MENKVKIKHIGRGSIVYGIILGIILISHVIDDMFFGNYPEWGWEGIFLFSPIVALVFTGVAIALFLLLTLIKKDWRKEKNFYISTIFIGLILVIISWL